MALQGTNISASTLNGAITDVATSLDVVSSSSFPTGGTFWIRIDDEIIKVTSVATNTFTVVRGEAGGGASAAVAHSSGATVTGVLTSQALTQLRADITRQGTHAAMAALTDMKSGDVFYFDGTDTPYHKVIYNGSSWDYYYLNFKCTPHDDTGYTWDSGTNTGATEGGTTKLTVVSEGASVRLFEKAVPADPYTVTALVKAVNGGTGTGELSVGIGLTAGGAPRIAWRFNPAGGARIQGNKWSTVTTFSASYSPQSTGIQFQDHMWLRVTDNSTNRSFFWSPDGVNWIDGPTHLRTDFLTPTTLGLVTTNISGASGYAWVLSWVVT